jgi:hypothetical protein
MKTYWDFTEIERSNLTEAEVGSLLDVELMKEGVKKPEPPKLTEVPKSPLGTKGRYFGVQTKSKYGSDEMLHISFATAELAQAFIDLNPLKSDYDYEVGSEFRYALPLQDASIVSEELYTLDQINQHRSSLKQRKALSEENQRLTSEFTKQSALAERITDEVWKDWYSVRAKSDDLKSIISTFNQYSKLTQGDAGMALAFLAKVNSHAEINEAREWFPGSIPTSEQDPIVTP